MTNAILRTYNEVADFCIRDLRKKDIITVYGEILENAVKIKAIEKS